MLAIQIDDIVGNERRCQTEIRSYLQNRVSSMNNFQTPISLIFCKLVEFRKSFRYSSDIQLSVYVVRKTDTVPFCQYNTMQSHPEICELC